jgi:pimeloyl-ACP methyl ester carboxylesterase
VREPLIFAHANSYGAATYRVLFEALGQRGFDVFAPSQLGHNPRFPVTDNWPHLVDELLHEAAPWLAQQARPVWWVGHSMGGYLSLMAAALHPQQAHGVLLLDAPLLAGWKAGAVNLAKRTQLVGRVSPGALSRKRRTHWSDVDAVRAHFQSKKAFARWDPAMLEDYVQHGTQDALVDGLTQRTLCFDRAVETAIYNTLPHHLNDFLRQHPLRCPAAFIGGLQSTEIRQVGLALTQRVCQGRLHLLDGGHLFPMEQPQVAASAIEASLRGLGAFAKTN